MGRFRGVALHADNIPRFRKRFAEVGGVFATRPHHDAIAAPVIVVSVLLASGVLSVDADHGGKKGLA